MRGCCSASRSPSLCGGEIRQQALQELRITASDLMEALRGKEYFSPPNCYGPRWSQTAVSAPHRCLKTAKPRPCCRCCWKARFTGRTSPFFGVDEPWLDDRLAEKQLTRPQVLLLLYNGKDLLIVPRQNQKGRPPKGPGKDRWSRNRYAVIPVGSAGADFMAGGAVREPHHGHPFAMSCKPLHPGRDRPNAAGTASYRAAADNAAQASKVLGMLVRRNLIDQMNQTLSLLPAVPKKRTTDLTLETDRACCQLQQIQQYHFSAVFDRLSSMSFNSSIKGVDVAELAVDGGEAHNRRHHPSA